jgi:predicted MPP superfamily phosphohydrolase
MHRWLTGPLTVERLTIPISGLPQDLHGCRLVQLSDFHFDGRSLSPWLLQQAIAAANACHPDLVVLTGDFVTHEPDPIHGLAHQLQHLRGRYGTCAVLGNHDNHSHHERQVIIQALEAVGIRVLWNAVAYPLGPDLSVVGLADFRSREFRPAPVMATVPDHLPRLVLSHNPDSAAILKSWRIDLQLSGHTHGGQVVLPGMGSVPGITQGIRQSAPRWVQRHVPYFNPACSRITRHWEWASGLHQVGSNRLYVNRGLGTYAPGRLFCPPEVTCITLVRA